MSPDVNGQRFLEADAGYITVGNDFSMSTVLADAFQPCIDDPSSFTTDLGEWAAMSSRVNLWQTTEAGPPPVFDSDSLPLSELDPSVFNYHRSINVHLNGPLDPYGEPEHGDLQGEITATAFVPAPNPWAAPASVVDAACKGPSDAVNCLLLLLVPAAGIVLRKARRP
jgi:hypothetical protein